MQKNTSFLKSLQCAWRGLWRAMRTERNLRVHFCIGNLICVFAWFFGLSRAEWGILCLAIGFVIVAELVNTAIEQTANAITKDYSEHVKFAKDVAAGAVFVATIAALVIGLVLFLDASRITYTLTYIFTNWKILIPCLLLGIGDILFLLFGGERNKYEKK